MDIVLTLPDPKIKMVWTFGGNTHWPTSPLTEEMSIETDFALWADPDHPRPSASEMRDLLLTMRKAYAQGQASFTSNSVPPTLDPAYIKDFVLQILDQQMDMAFEGTARWSGLADDQGNPVEK